MQTLKNKSSFFRHKSGCKMEKTRGEKKVPSPDENCCSVKYRVKVSDQTQLKKKNVVLSKTHLNFLKLQL